jgi:hypothetical protein
MSTIVEGGGQPRTRRKPSYLDLLEEADQHRIYDDLATFFGPNADTYLDIYERMRIASTGSRRKMPRTWSWPVFFGSFTWFFYRKMYGYGAMLIFTPVIVAYLLGSSSWVTGLLFAMGAKGWYVQSAVRRVYKADQLGLSGRERQDYLQQAGGVSRVAGVFAGLIYALLLAAVIYAAAHKPRH